MHCNEEIQVEDQQVIEEVRSALEGCTAFYATLASLYFKPLTQEQIDGIATTDFSAYEGINADFDEGLRDMLVFLRRRNSGTRQELAVDFTAAFAGTSIYKGKSAVPYKSVFMPGKGLLYGEGRKSVFDAYKSACVRMRDGIDLPDDHLSFMCEFMGKLALRAAESLEEGDRKEAVHTIETSRSFLEDNILSWFDEFTDLASHIISTRFYRGVMKMTRGFLLFNRDMLDDMSAALKG